MKTKFLLILLVASLVISSCGKKDKSSGSGPAPSATPRATKPADQATLKPADQAALKPADQAVIKSKDKDITKPTTKTDKVVYSQKTPQDALKTFVECFNNGDRKNFLGLISGSPYTSEVMLIVFDYTAAAKSFNKAVMDAYGSEAAQKAIKGYPPAPSMFDSWRDKLNTMEFKQKNNIATCIVPDKLNPLTFIRKESKWYVDPNIVVLDTNKDTIEMLRGSMPKMTQAIKDAQKKVGQAGVTAQSLGEELATKIKAILRSGLPATAQPEINKLNQETIKK